MVWSPVDASVSSALDLTTAWAPLGIGCDVVWPLTGMVLYDTMTRVLRKRDAGGKPPGAPAAVVQMYNMWIIAVSFLILVATLFFRLTGTSSMQQAYCPLGAASPISNGLRLCFWAYHVSKYAEYADTVFLILKGKDVGNLHFWHHMVVTFTSWTWFRSNIAWVADGVIFNTFVHCIMYYYYYLCQAGRPPWWKRYVTSLQIFQFMMSFVFTAVWAYYHATVGCECTSVIGLSVAFNGWLLAMFINFYLTSFGKKK